VAVSFSQKTGKEGFYCNRKEKAWEEQRRNFKSQKDKKKINSKKENAKLKQNPNDKFQVLDHLFSSKSLKHKDAQIGRLYKFVRDVDVAPLGLNRFGASVYGRYAPD
jgi:hypothetical protein